MKIVANGLFLFISVFFLISSRCLEPTGSQTLPVINLTGDDSGKELSVLKGQKLNLTLPDRVDGGYRFDKALYDTTILKLEKHWETLPGASSPPGKPGMAVWQFTATKSGHTG